MKQYLSGTDSSSKLNISHKWLESSALLFSVKGYFDLISGNHVNAAQSWFPSSARDASNTFWRFLATIVPARNTGDFDSILNGTTGNGTFRNSGQRCITTGRIVPRNGCANVPAGSASGMFLAECFWPTFRSRQTSMIGSLPRRTANERSGSQGSEWCVLCGGDEEEGVGLIDSL